MPRDVIVVGGTLAGLAAALSARRCRASVHLVMQGARPPGPADALPADARERATQWVARVPVQPPEEAHVFGLRARRLRRWLDELGVGAGPDWPAGMHAALLARCEREGVGMDEARIVIDLVASKRAVSGVIFVEDDAADTAQADAVILATGDLAALFVDAPTTDPLTGLAIGARAGIEPVGLEQIGFRAASPFRCAGGFAIDGRGQTALAGLVAVGPCGAAPWKADPALAPVEDVVRATEAGSFEGPPGHGGTPRLPSDIDEPLPAGFVEPKIARLRDLWSSAAGPRRSAGAVEKAEVGLTQLRGEATDYARARLQADAHLFSHMADAALLGVRALKQSSRGLHSLDA